MYVLRFIKKTTALLTMFESYYVRPRIFDGKNDICLILNVSVEQINAPVYVLLRNDEIKTLSYKIITTARLHHRHLDNHNNQECDFHNDLQRPARPRSPSQPLPLNHIRPDQITLILPPQSPSLSDSGWSVVVLSTVFLFVCSLIVV